METSVLLLSGISVIISTIIGTALGAYLIILKNENKIKSVRKIAVTALNVIGKYVKSKETYDNAQDEFNNALTIAEKRAVLVCLHKLGVPIEVPVGQMFNIKEIQFAPNPVDVEEIEGMKIQVEKGHCDNFFFMDVDAHFKGDNYIRTLRSIGKRFLKEVLNESFYDKKQNQRQ